MEQLYGVVTDISEPMVNFTANLNCAGHQNYSNCVGLTRLINFRGRDIWFSFVRNTKSSYSLTCSLAYNNLCLTGRKQTFALTA